MLELYKIGISENDLKNMVDSNSEILDLDEAEVIKKIEYLKCIGCNEDQIKNILIGNPWYLSRVLSDVSTTIQKLKELGLEAIHLMIESNPLLLNMDSFEIIDFIERKTKEGYELDNIIDMIDENPTIITE